MKSHTNNTAILAQIHELSLCDSTRQILSSHEIASCIHRSPQPETASGD